jgi:mRNA interferase MazF
VVISQGEIWWANLREPQGSGPGHQRPVVVVQADEVNRSRLRTVICVPLTSNRKWASLPGNVELATRDTGLPRSSVANVTQIIALDRGVLTEQIGRLTASKLDLILGGIDIVLGRSA